MRRLSRPIVCLLLMLVLGAVYAAPSVRVLGRLGQAMSATKIRTRMSSRSQAYYRVRPYEYLVVRDSPRSDWLRVLMQNGQYGYVPTNTVAQLPYEVTTTPSRDRSGYSAPATRSGSAVANYAMHFLGTPYKWGGNDENAGIDCSGFVKKMYGTIGVELPRTAAEQALVGMPITRLEDLQAGDRLYFWEKKRGKIGHTGIYLGGGYFVHSSMGHRGVATDYLTARWRGILVAARR